MSLFDSYEIDGEGADGTEGHEPPGCPVEGPPPPLGDVPELAPGVDENGQPVVPGPDDSGTMPSAEDVARARMELVGDDGSPAGVSAQEEPEQQAQPAAAAGAAAPAADAAEAPTKADAEAELARANESAETAQLLSNIASVRHQTAMGIIGNIR